MSITRACAGVGLSKATYYRAESCPDADAEVVDALNGRVAAHPRWGFWKCFGKLRLEGRPWNHKRVHRVYCAMRLNLPRRTRKRLPVRERQSLAIPAQPNAVWSMDFMSDTLHHGRRFRVFNVLDEGVREALAIEIDTALPSGRIIRVLEQLKAWRGLPQAIRCDNGPELTAQVFLDGCEQQGVELRHIQPGKPNQNAYIERFNRSYREEVLNAYLFADLDQVREITHQWLLTYNEERPHDALGGLPPATFRERLTTAGSSIYQQFT